MNKMLTVLKNEDGQGMVEYGLIIALVAVAVVGVVTVLGRNLDGIFGNINGVLEGAGSITDPK